MYISPVYISGGHIPYNNSCTHIVYTYYDDIYHDIINIHILYTYYDDIYHDHSFYLYLQFYLLFILILSTFCIPINRFISQIMFVYVPLYCFFLL